MLGNKWRFVWMIATGILVHELIHLIVPISDKNGWYGYTMGGVQSVLITVLIWEGSLRFDRILNRALPWVKHPVRRILVQFPLEFAYTFVVLLGVMWFFNAFVCEVPVRNYDFFLLIVTAIALAIGTFILLIELAIQFFRNWKQSLLQVEHYKAETAYARLESLKHQINPHFLFNNMSVLSSLVYKDQDKAVQFINQLSKVYRYLLDNAGHELRTLEEEMTFIRSYTYLLDIRYSPNLHFRIDLEAAQHHKLLPPLSIQLLIENAIKHNIVSSEQPLIISLCTDGNWFIVENNLQLRAVAEETSGTGLNNICLRYQHFTDVQPEIKQTESSFLVKIPLLQRS